jgi:type IV secretion system protein VirD4
MTFAQEFPHGSARFAEYREVRQAFREAGGPPLGAFGGRFLHHSKQAGALLIGGAGSGKLVTMLAHVMGDPGRKGEPPRYAILDPKGEMAAVIGPGLVHRGAHVYCINPYGLHGIPGLRVALLGHLKPNSPTLVADSRRVARTLLAESGGGEARFFEQKGQNWIDALIRGLVHADGEVSFLSLFDLVGMIRAAPDAWAEISESMAALGEPDLRMTYAEMHQMAAEGERTYQAILGEIGNALGFMTDPALQRSFTASAGAEFSLEALAEASKRPVFVFLMMPAELLAQNAALIRQFFSALRTMKQRRPQAPTVNFVIDEAAQLGSFQEIAEFYAIGRGFGLSPLCVYQDIGQIRRNLGATGAMTLSASADVEIYLGGGIADLETAQHLSRKLGDQTLALDDRLTRERAARAKREAVHAMLYKGADPMATGLAMQSLGYEMEHVRRMGRPLMTPDEILAMRQDKALVWARGYGVRPYFTDKVPYYTRPEYAGRYFPNPYYDRDMTRLRVATRWGYRTRNVMRETVPDRYRDFPQYGSGEWQFIEGHRPAT